MFFSLSRFAHHWLPESANLSDEVRTYFFGHFSFTALASPQNPNPFSLRGMVKGRESQYSFSAPINQCATGSTRSGKWIQSPPARGRPPCCLPLPSPSCRYCLRCHCQVLLKFKWKEDQKGLILKKCAIEAKKYDLI